MKTKTILAAAGSVLLLGTVAVAQTYSTPPATTDQPDAATTTDMNAQTDTSGTMDTTMAGERG